MSRWSPFVTIRELPDTSRYKMLEAAEFPLTVFGLAERFAVHYGDRVAFVDGDWKYVLGGEWYSSRGSCALGVMSVIRSLSGPEIDHGKRSKNEYLEAGERFENTPDIVEHVLSAASYMVSPDEFTPLIDEQ